MSACRSSRAGSDSPVWVAARFRNSSKSVEEHKDSVTIRGMGERSPRSAFVMILLSDKAVVFRPVCGSVCPFRPYIILFHLSGVRERKDYCSGLRFPLFREGIVQFNDEGLND